MESSRMNVGLKKEISFSEGKIPPKSRLYLSHSHWLQVQATSVLNRWIIVTGGKSIQEYNRKTYIFDFDTVSQQWTESAIGLLPPRIFHKCIAIGSQIISIYYPMQSIYINQLISDWNYEKVKYFILLRQQLIDDERAYPIIHANATEIRETCQSTNMTRHRHGRKPDSLL